MRHIIPISGKDSLATAIFQTAKEPDLNYEFVFNDVGWDFPEVLEWIKKVESHLGKKITIIGADLSKIVEDAGYFLPSGRARYCTRKAKIEPFVKWIGNDECLVYYGIRSDEQRHGFNNSTSMNIKPVYPLAEAGIDLNGVYIINNTVKLKPPTFFWENLHTEVINILGHDPKYLPEWIYDNLFAWRSRSNCDKCFFQRLYEWVGLLEHHPDRFYEAEKMETMGGSEKRFNWNSNRSLIYISENKDQIFRKRVEKVVKIIRVFNQEKLFSDNDENYFDVLSIKSCGLFCGK